MDCTWYLFSITQLLYLQDQELQTWLYKCYMCTSEVLSWHFLLFSFPFVHSYAFLFHLPQLWSKRGLKISAITASKRFSLTKTSTLIEKPTVGLKTCGGHCRREHDEAVSSGIEVFGFTGRLETNSACRILLLLQEAVRLTII